MSPILRLLTSCVIFYSCISFGKSPPPGSGAADIPVNVLLMLDTSGSMGISADFGNARDIAIDSKGNMYLPMFDAHNVRKLNQYGETTQPIGAGLGTADGFYDHPTNAVIDGNDNLFIADRDNERIQVFDSTGQHIASYVLNSGESPTSIGLDSSGNLYALVSDTEVIKINRTNGTRSVFELTNTGGNDPQISKFTIYDDHLYAIGSHNRSWHRNWPSTSSWYYYSNTERYEIFKFDLNNESGNNFALVDSIMESGWSYQSRLGNANDIEVTDNGIFVLTACAISKVSEADFSEYQVSPQEIYSMGYYYCDDYFGMGSDSSGNLYAAGLDGVVKVNADGDLQDEFGADTTRLDLLKQVIKLLVQDSDLTSSAHFGLMEWNTSERMIVNVSEAGANEIYSEVDKLTDGGGTLLEDAMELAEEYLGGPDSPIDPDLECQKTILLVFSDGEWFDDPDAIAGKFEADGIDTYVVGLDDGLDASAKASYESLAKAGGTFPDSPLYASDWFALYQAMSSLIIKAISEQQSFAAPTVLPSTGGGDNHLLQPSFKHNSSGQWQGRLKKIRLNADGSIGDAVWDAGEVLAQRSPATRNIWTVQSGNTGLNNFNELNVASLSPLIYENTAPASQAEATQLINFVRGLDSFDEDEDGDSSEPRWMLGDIYNSKPILVGSPSLSSTDDPQKINTEEFFRSQKNYQNFSSLQRNEVIYVGANDGMLHAFDAETGAEKWAFIPPMLLSELPALKGSAPNTTKSIYGVDGSPSVRDVYVDGAWKTILICGLGAGGHGYFALDVTDPDSPTFLWAFENNQKVNAVRYWAFDGSLVEYSDPAAVPASYNYFDLGETWSKPQIALIEHNGVQKYVAVMGGGYNGGVQNGLGSAVFVIDLSDNGRLLFKTELESTVSDVPNSVPADVTLLTPDSTGETSFRGAMGYVTDTQGQLWKINLTNYGPLAAATALFDGQASNLADRKSFFGPSAAFSRTGKLWLYYGTGDRANLGSSSLTIQNRVFGIADSDFPSFISYPEAATIDDLADTTDSGAMCPNATQLGWYVNLDPLEKITGKITIHNKTLFVSRYRPNKDDACKPGSAVLSEHGYMCGNTEGSHDLGIGVPSQAVVFNGKIYVGISQSDEEATIGANFTKSGNVIVGESSQNAFSAGSAVIEGWREIF